MANSYTQIYIHYIFSTKNREPLILPEYENRLWRYIAGIGKNHGIPVICAGGVADHLHLLVTISSTISVSKTIQLFKGNSSKWMNDIFYPDTREFQWQSGYGAFSVSHSGVEGVEWYIRNQKKHHEKMTFREEYIWFLNKYGIEYDERYLWD